MRTKDYPAAVAVTLGGIIGAVVLGVFAEADLPQHVGFGLALIGLAILVFFLTREIRHDISESRVQFMARVAEEAIRYLDPTPDLDEEWRRLSG